MMNKYEERRNKLKLIFQDTLSCIEKDNRLKLETSRMAGSTVVYTDEIGTLSKCKKYSDITIEVVEDTTFSCARKHVKSGKVVVLNFANSIHPGGGVVKGALAQEECLCRSSNLYRGLTTPLMLSRYYKRNRRLDNSVGSDTVAYHPGVTVFKDDDVLANALHPDDWFYVDVITCAAPKLSVYNHISDEQLYEIHVKRGRRIIEAAIVNGADVLILGAFGCGAFRNNPMIVAEAYRHLLLDEGYSAYFERVIFAIKKDHNEVKGNYHCFKKILGC